MKTEDMCPDCKKITTMHTDIVIQSLFCNDCGRRLKRIKNDEKNEIGRSKNWEKIGS